MNENVQFQLLTVPEHIMNFEKLENVEEVEEVQKVSFLKKIWEGKVYF